MEFTTSTGHPVLHYLAVARAARDFGLDPRQLDPLALRFAPTRASADTFAQAVNDAGQAHPLDGTTVAGDIRAAPSASRQSPSIRQLRPTVARTYNRCWPRCPGRRRTIQPAGVGRR
jgi:hypothetical protein